MEGIYCYVDLKDNSIVYVGKDSNIDKKSRYYGEHFMKCRYCKKYKHIDDIFGYCHKYQAQATVYDNCERIRKIRNDDTSLN